MVVLKNDVIIAILHQFEYSTHIIEYCNFRNSNPVITDIMASVHLK